MLRGINGQIIFEDNEDYEKLIETIVKYKEICEYDIYGFCLMSNHIHLLIKEVKEDLGVTFRRIGAKGVCNIKSALRLFEDEEKRAVELFEKFNREENNDRCLEYGESVRIDDIEATKIIIKVTGFKNTKQIENLAKEKRNKIIKELKNKGLSIRQIERLTGISFGVIRRI